MIFLFTLVIIELYNCKKMTFSLIIINQNLKHTIND